MKTPAYPDALSDAARSAWAKSPDEHDRWLPLWQHMDDAADVARHLFDRWLAPNVTALLTAAFGGSRDDARIAVTFLAGIHDLAKATPAFAVQHELLAQRMRNQGLYMPETKRQLHDRHLAHHAVAGHHLLVRWLTERGWHKATARSWGVVLGGHHGTPPDAVSERAASPRDVPHLYGSDAWETVQDQLAWRIARRTGAADRLDDWQYCVLSQQSQVILTGIVIVADWIASNEELLPYHAGELPEVVDRTERVATALATLHLPRPWQLRGVPDDIDELFASRFELPAGAIPRPIQRLVVDVVRELSEPGLVIVEAAMGEGKTEAALAATEVLAERFGAGGAFVALPTQATTDAMFTRIVAWLDALGADEHAVGGAIALAHGKSRHNRLFAGLVTAGRAREVGNDDLRSERTRTRQRGQRPAPAHAVVAHTWLSGRKKAQLANFTIATIDQLLFAGLKSRHLMLRHLALAGKVVVLDEIHAYDAYMNSYLSKVLTWLGAYGVPVVALSATLPSERRRELVEAYRAGRAKDPTSSQLAAADDDPIDGDIGYPVVTWTEPSGARRRTAKASGRRTTVAIDGLEDDLDALVDLLCTQLSDGGTALVVRNTVRRVLAAADRIEAAFPGEVTVSHSRFITADRLQRDAALVDRFGPPGRAARPHRHIVVASQVVEQSLDVDFDLLVTDLAPIDLVLQRMGRVHRHQRGEGQSDRPAKLRVAHTYITAVDFSVDPPELDPSAARYVYDAHTLLRAAAVLIPRFGASIELPDDIAPLVQHAYGSETLGPSTWQEAMRDAREHAERTRAKRIEKAASFQLADPQRPGKAIVGWVAADVGDTDDESSGHGQVRDGAPSLEAMLVQVGPDGRWRTPPWLPDGSGGCSIPRDNVPDRATANIMATCSLRLPLQFSDADAEDALWEATPPAWERERAIYHLPVLVVDHDGYGAIDGTRIRYTPDRGLEVIEDDH